MAIGGLDSSLLSSQFNLLSSISRLSNLSLASKLSTLATNSSSQTALFGSSFNTFFQNTPAATGAADLATKAKALTDTGSSGVLQKKTIEIEAEDTVDDTALSATANSFAKVGQTLDIEVSQLATGQTSISNTLATAAPTALGPGSYTFSIVPQGDTVGQSFTVNVAGGETNQDIFDAIEAEIESREGYDVEIETTSAGNARVRVGGEDTGSGRAFSIQDLSGTLAATLGLTNTGTVTEASATGGVVQAAQNATFTVNGVAQESATNSQVLVNGTVFVDFNRETVDNVQLTVKGDAEEIKTAVEDFAESFNSQLSTLEKSSSIRDALSAQNLRTAAFLNEKKLRDVGITVEASGRLTVDEEKLSEAAEDDVAGIAEAFRGGTGVATLAGAEANATLNTPLVFGGESLSTLFKAGNSPVSQFSLNSQESLNSLFGGSQGIFLSFLS